MNLNSPTKNLIFFNIPAALFCCLPLFLVSGPFLSDMAIVLVSIIFISYCFINKDFSFFKTKYFIFFLLFWSYLILNSLFNNQNLGSLKISIFYIRFAIFTTAIVAILNHNSKIINYFFYSLAISFILLICDGYYQYFFGENILGWKMSVSNRISSFFGEELILGSYLSRMFPIFFALSIFLFKKNSKVSILIFIFFILIETLVFLSGERTAFFYINLSAIFIIFFSNNLKLIRTITLITAFILISIITFFSPAAKERIVDKTIDQMNIYNDLSNNKEITKGKNNKEITKGKKNEKYIFSKQHTHHYFTAFKMFKENKFFGVGVKNFRNYCSHKKYSYGPLSCSTHPHNTYVQLLSETGIVGFLFILILMFYFIFYSLKHYYYKFKQKIIFNDFEICILSGILIVIWPIAPTGNVFNNWLSVTYYLYLPFFIWSIGANTYFNDNNV